MVRKSCADKAGDISRNVAKEAHKVLRNGVAIAENDNLHS
jgi:hypothetical protein